MVVSDESNSGLEDSSTLFVPGVVAVAALTALVGCRGLTYDLDSIEPPEDQEETVDCDPEAAPFGGDGTDGDVRPICTPEHLVAMAESDLDATYELAADIDMNDADTTALPIGTSDAPFQGELVGNGYRISGLEMEREERGRAFGLFGVIGEDGAIRDVVLRELAITAEISTGDDFEASVGGVAGINRGTVENCRIDGEIRGEAVEDQLPDVDFNTPATGGLIGWNRGEVVDSSTSGSVDGVVWVGGLVGLNEEGTISTSRSTAQIQGLDLVGGLVGQNRGGEIGESSATGSVQGEFLVGGFCGENLGDSVIYQSLSTGEVEGLEPVGGLCGASVDSEISDAYALGDPEGEIAIGGLVGELVSDETDPLIRHSYGAGRPDGDEAVGGLVGEADDSVRVESSYWDTTISDIESSTVEGAEGLTTDEFEIQDHFEDWNFRNTWMIGTVADGTVRPRLQWRDRRENQ